MQLVIFVGLQGAGKTSFFRGRFASTHMHISKDHMPNVKNRNRRQEKLLRDALQQSYSVVVDNTNPVTTDRASLITIGREYDAEIIGFYFESKVGDCLQRNAMRQGKERVPDLALFATIKKLEPPSYNEGFDQLFYVRIGEAGSFEVSPWDTDCEER